MDWSLLGELAKSEAESIISRPDISQPACAALQISLVRYLSCFLFFFSFFLLLLFYWLFIVFKECGSPMVSSPVLLLGTVVVRLQLLTVLAFSLWKRQ